MSRRWPLWLCSFVSSIAVAQWETPGRWQTWDPEFEMQRKAWKELEAQLPPLPDEHSLQEFKPSAATDHRYFIDPRSISVDGDGVVRYTLVIRSSSGARNVTFEGMRCNARQYRLYAIGQNTGWTRASNSQWQNISRTLDRNRQHIELFVNYFCPGGIIVDNAAEAREALIQGSHPRTIEKNLP